MKLGLVAMDQIIAAGLGGQEITLPTFLVQVEIRGMLPLTIEVAASKEELFLLLGRDVLNHFYLVLNGPEQVLEIS
jgi:hypothetical protein